MAVSTVCSKFDNIVGSKIKMLVQEEVDLKIKDISSSLQAIKGQKTSKNNRKKLLNVVK